MPWNLSHGIDCGIDGENGIQWWRISDLLHLCVETENAVSVQHDN